MLEEPLPYRTSQEAVQRYHGRVQQLNSDGSGCISLEENFLGLDHAFFVLEDVRLRSKPVMGMRVSFSLAIDPEELCLCAGAVGGAERARSRSRSREDRRAPLQRKPQTVPPRVFANGHSRMPGSDSELPETAKMLEAERLCVSGARHEESLSDQFGLDELKAEDDDETLLEAEDDLLDESPARATGSDTPDGDKEEDQDRGPGLEDDLREHLRQEQRRTSSSRFRKKLVAFKMWTGSIFNWFPESEEGWILPDEEIRHECLATSGLVWFSHDHTEADLPEFADGRRVQFLVYEQNGSLGAIFVALAGTDQEEDDRCSRSNGGRWYSMDWQTPDFQDEPDEPEDGEEEDAEEDQEVSSAPSWFRQGGSERRVDDAEEDAEAPHFEVDDEDEDDKEDLELGDRPKAAQAAKPAKPAKAPASSSRPSSSAAPPKMPLAVSSARQALHDEVSQIAESLVSETQWSRGELMRRLMRYLSHGLAKVESKLQSIESWQDGAQTFIRESSAQFYWTCCGKPWYTAAEEKIKPALFQVAWELVKECQDVGGSSQVILHEMIEEVFDRYAEQRNFQDTVHNAVAESFQGLEDDVRKKVFMQLTKTHPGACEAATVAPGTKVKKLEAFVRQWMKDSMDRSYNAVKQKDIFSEKRMTLLFKCLISPAESEYTCVPRACIPDTVERPPRNWKFVREAVMELLGRWQQNSKK